MDLCYGKFVIMQVMLLQMVSNFDNGVYGQDVFIDIVYKLEGGVVVKILVLKVENGWLCVLVEWILMGFEVIKLKGYCYFSVEYYENW